MSGVMIKCGIYGIIRTLCFLGVGQEWWAWLMVIVGVVSGVLGILFALGQRDIKRFLAYSSVENIGIIALGIGIGMLGVRLNVPGAAVLGFGGALLHVLNHAIFKGLLFLCAGAVLHATHTANMERLGGTPPPDAAHCHPVCGRRDGDFRTSAAQWIPQRIPDLPGGVRGRTVVAVHLDDSRASHDWRPGSHRRLGGGRIHARVRRRIPRRTTHRQAPNTSMLPDG